MVSLVPERFTTGGGPHGRRQPRFRPVRLALAANSLIFDTTERYKQYPRLLATSGCVFLSSGSSLCRLTPGEGRKSELPQTTGGVSVHKYAAGWGQTTTSRPPPPGECFWFKLPTHFFARLLHGRDPPTGGVQEAGGIFPHLLLLSAEKTCVGGLHTVNTSPTYAK